jgi:hypothetical protein
MKAPLHRLFPIAFPTMIATLSTIVALAALSTIASMPAIAQNLTEEDFQNPDTKGTFYIKPNCQVTATANADYFRLKQRFPVVIDDSEYQLYTGMFNDGSPIVCLAQRDLSQPQVVKIPQLSFLDTVKLDRTQPNAFVFRSREGNGMEVPINHWGVVFKTTQPEVIDRSVLKQTGKVRKGQKATHSFRAKAGQSLTINLDSRAQAQFILVNQAGARVATGQAVDNISPGVTGVTLTIPADDTYRVVISGGKGDRASYALSVNRT